MSDSQEVIVIFFKVQNDLCDLKGSTCDVMNPVLPSRYLTYYFFSSLSIKECQNIMFAATYDLFFAFKFGIWNMDYGLFFNIFPQKATLPQVFDTD